MILKLLISSTAILILSSCRLNEKKSDLDNWKGTYTYEEEPIKAIAGYFMSMEWNLSITENDDNYQGILEINGQQTHTRLLTDITGDREAIAVIYSSRIDGLGDNLKKGDTLFILSKANNTLLTRWFALAPMLSEKKPPECNCFARTAQKEKQ